MSKEFFESAIETYLNQFEDSLESLGVVARRQMIVPFCKKHGLEFVQGNGIFVFCKNGEPTTDNWVDWNNHLKASKSAPKGFQDILDVLNIEIGYNTYFFQYIGDCRFGDKS